VPLGRSLATPRFRVCRPLGTLPCHPFSDRERMVRSPRDRNRCWVPFRPVLGRCKEIENVRDVAVDKDLLSAVAGNNRMVV
jgi:hypothetical protein